MTSVTRQPMRESFVSTEDKNKSELERGIINCQSQIDNGKVCLSEMKGDPGSPT